MAAKTSNEPMWHMELTVLCAAILQLILREQLSFGSKYLIVGLECVLLLSMIILRSTDSAVGNTWHRRLTVLLTGFISVANIGSLIMILRALVNHPDGLNGHTLIYSAIATFLTNIIVFGLWYWQLDGGGPGGRGAHQPPVDFVFPQMTIEDAVTKTPNWQPAFFDYLYLSFTNATAFSPTDVMPLTHRAKLLMIVQSLTSLTTIAVVAARAVNILG